MTGACDLFLPPPSFCASIMACLFCSASSSLFFFSSASFAFLSASSFLTRSSSSFFCWASFFSCSALISFLLACLSFSLFSSSSSLALCFLLLFRPDLFPLGLFVLQSLQLLLLLLPLLLRLLLLVCR